MAGCPTFVGLRSGKMTGEDLGRVWRFLEDKIPGLIPLSLGLALRDPLQRLDLQDPLQRLDLRDPLQRLDPWDPLQPGK